MREEKKIILCTDHAGLELKEYIKKRLKKDHFIVEDIGVYDHKRVDYPDIISKGARTIHSGKYKRGIFLCGSGIGASITANRFKRVRAALVYNENTAILSRKHNDANVIVFGGRMISFPKAYQLFQIWWNTEFSKGRHLKRVKKLGRIRN